jgi:hypothetical protein
MNARLLNVCVTKIIMSVATKELCFGVGDSSTSPRESQVIDQLRKAEASTRAHIQNDRQSYKVLRHSAPAILKQICTLYFLHVLLLQIEDQGAEG